MKLSTSQAAEVISVGGVIAYPTEAVWGLGCDPQNQAAVEKTLALKQRSVEKGLILVAASLRQLSSYFHPSLNEKQLAKIQQCSRPTTWLVPFNSDYTPAWIVGEHEFLAIRVSSHPTTQALCQLTHYPIVSTSANPQGREAARTALEVRQYFGDDLPICEGQCGDAERPSTIRSLLTGEILRE